MFSDWCQILHLFCCTTFVNCIIQVYFFFFFFFFFFYYFLSALSAHGYLKNAAMNMSVQISFQDPASYSFGWTLRNGIAGPCGNSLGTYIPFSSGSAIIHSANSAKFPISHILTDPCYFLGFGIAAILISARGYSDRGFCVDMCFGFSGKIFRSGIRGWCDKHVFNPRGDTQGSKGVENVLRGGRKVCKCRGSESGWAYSSSLFLPIHPAVLSGSPP